MASVSKLFIITAFLPASSKHTGVECFGVQLHITDREAFRPVTTGLPVIATYRALAPNRFEFLKTSWEGRPPHFDLLTGDARVRDGLLAGQSIETLTRAWENDLARFDKTRKKYLLY